MLIALLPKPDGGLRPIGLIPLLPRVWARARRDIVTEWEKGPTGITFMLAEVWELM